MNETIEDLCAQLLAAKAEETKAKERRVGIEEKIVAITGKKDKGSKTTDYGTWKVTVTGVMNYKMDWEKWAEVQGLIPEALRPVKFKPEVDDKGIEWLKNNKPEIYAKIPVTITPGKTGVEVKRVEA